MDRILVHKETTSADNRIEFVCINGCCCDSVLNVHAPAKDESDYAKGI
jgi:hypothetical protein